MIRRPPTSVSVQESDVETLKAQRRAKMIQQNPALTNSSFASIRPDDSGSTYDQPASHALHNLGHHHHPLHYQHHSRENHLHEDPGTQPGLSQQENHNPNQNQNQNQDQNQNQQNQNQQNQNQQNQNQQNENENENNSNT
jgi:hypothetical protein